MKDNHTETGHGNPTPQGEAAPPHFAGTMGVVRWVILGVMTVFAVVMVLSYFGATPWTSHAEADTLYHCPMHPTYVSNQPGDCPICGMSLVPVSSDGEAPPDTGHTSIVPGLAPITLETRRVQMIGLKTGIVEKRPIQNRSRLAGYVTVDETRTAGVNVRTSGWVQTLHVNQTGQMVSPGAPLLSLYSQDLYVAQQDLLVALAAYDKSSGDSALAEARRRVLEAARDRLRLLGMLPEDIARLESTGEAKSELTLRSPFSGVVMEKNVIEGEFISPDMTLLRIADLRTVWILADVYEQDIAAIREGTPARMSMTAFPGEIFEGKVGFVYPSVSEATRTLKVRLEFPNPSLRLRPGMYAEIDLVEGGPEVVAIPFEAVMDGGETQYAFVVRDRTSFEPRLITTGRRSDDWVEVLSGLDVGEEVVTSANFLIDSESRLRAAIAGMGGSGSSAAGHSH
jgi:Cu(I)/Ag(I) efflux system membrane fusion protein